MKRIVLLPLLLTLLTPSVWAQQEIGGFFTLVNTYIYPVKGKENSRILVRPLGAFDVVDLDVDDQERLWYQIIYPARTKTVEGFGWIPLAPGQLIAMGQQSATVYASVPTAAGDGTETLQVPLNKLELLNETQRNEAFPQVSWQRVRYQAQQPLPAWVRAATGIFRPGRDANALAQAHALMVRLKVEDERMQRLLSGVVQIGDSTREVTWALGEPLREQVETINQVQRLIWVYRDVELQFENTVVTKVN